MIIGFSSSPPGDTMAMLLLRTGTKCKSLCSTSRSTAGSGRCFVSCVDSSGSVSNVSGSILPLADGVTFLPVVQHQVEVLLPFCGGHLPKHCHAASHKILSGLLILNQTDSQWRTLSDPRFRIPIPNRLLGPRGRIFLFPDKLGLNYGLVELFGLHSHGGPF